MVEIIEAELVRLEAVHDVIARYAADRSQTLAKHDAEIAQLKRERLESVSWREKNDLAEKLVEHGHYNPRKYLIEYGQQHSPYFGILGIDDSVLGEREYLIGNQALMDGTKVAIVDWRKADVTRFYYDYEVGEDYEETIRGIDREGVITRRDKVGIAKKELHRIETASETYDLVDGQWRKDGALCETSSELKTQANDHRMVESIAALISAEQFRAITKQREGAVLIEGGAGAGKTTVALHRLSFLMFDAPELYRPEKCIVLMFNRVLREYVRQTCDNLLGNVRVDTYSAWSLTALGAMGIYSLKTVFEDPFGEQKKSSKISALLARYVKETRRIEPVMDLWRFYSTEYVAEALLGRNGGGFIEAARRKAERRERVISFSDASILLRLSQLRRPPEVVVEWALNSYVHVVVDEAQDLALIELETILAATTFDRGLTICADEKQQILSFLDGQGLATFKTKLHARGLGKESLTVSYRCPKEIIELAARVVGRPVDTSKVRSGGIVNYHSMKNSAESMSQVRQIAGELAEANPGTLTAIICKKKADVKALHGALAGLPGLHEEGEISFTPGVQITHAHAIKGVEFTHVILYNPSSYDYRQTAPDRNLLYVAITRACRRIDIVHHQPLAKGLQEETPLQ